QSLIDTTPLSRPSSVFTSDKNDAGLAIGKTFSDPLGNIRVTTLFSGGVPPQEYLDVQVVFLDEGAFGFYTGADLATKGLVGSYVNSNLRARAIHDDWRTATGITIGGRRIDRSLNFTSDSWGARAPLRLTGGTEANWDNFSVQWDGYVVERRPVRLATTSDDSSRFWIDLNDNGSFSTIAPEFVNNHWGTGQGPTRGDLSPIIPPGTYRIRIQYEEGGGGNYFTMGGADIPFEVFTDEDGATPGLTGSYVARSLRTSTAQNDWRVTQAIAGTREDAYPGFTATSWGNLTDVGLSAGANGSDGDWDNFSVQWDGFLKVSAPIKMATISDDHSRMWIDLNTNGTFATTVPEYINNGWGGGGQGTTLGQVSTVIQPGMYRIRIQYEEGGGGNYFLLAGVPQYPADPPTLFNSLLFSGIENRTTSRTIAGDFTVQFWLKTTQIAGGESHWADGMGLVDASVLAGPGFGITLGNGKILFGSGDLLENTTLRSGFVADDQWHHVSARRVQASGEMTLFVDGLEMGQAFGVTNLFEAVTDLTVGSLNGGLNFYAGQFDQLKLWSTARSDEQLVADFQQARNTHAYADLPPEVRLTAVENFVQVYWDPLSGYRKLEGATTLNGGFVPLATDQNFTNINMGPNQMRFFRVRR
ncbi:MAG: LamG-like jellyroll fold domain-containing protein, partial [Limisphaerales bacterium]